ncbi:hypothetical protein BHM03_00000747 [Ensete ventricosum]|nr:hypothetical protein BHM03_00000747 [Ensete ventricosum]
MLLGNGRAQIKRVRERGGGKGTEEGRREKAEKVNDEATGATWGGVNGTNIGTAPDDPISTRKSNRCLARSRILDADGDPRPSMHARATDFMPSSDVLSKILDDESIPVPQRLNAIDLRGASDLGREANL